jgi:hypothetical protein
MRLSGSFGPGSREELCGDVSMIEQTGNEYWSKRLTDGANELAVSIQNSIQSKQLESPSDSATENSMDHREESDAKRMETVLILYLSPSLRFHVHLFHFCLKSFFLFCFFADFSFHDRIFEVWEIFCSTRYYYWARVPCSLTTGKIWLKVQGFFPRFLVLYCHLQYIVSCDEIKMLKMGTFLSSFLY